MAIGLQEWALILVVVLLLFGAAAIPKLARSLGRAQGEFRKARAEFDTEAAKAEAEALKSGAASPAADEESVRRTARSLGIDDAGKDVAELRRLIQEKTA